MGLFFLFFFIIIFIIYFIFYLCMLLTFIFVCVCLCGFFVSMGRVFLTGGGCVVSCNGTKDKNSIKQIVACVVCYSGSKYGTYFLITRVYCGFRPWKQHVSHPRPCPKIAPHPFFILFFILKISNKKTAPKHFRARVVSMRVSSRCTICLKPNIRFSF